MAVFKVTGENKSVFGTEKFSNRLRFSSIRERDNYQETGEHKDMPYRFRCCDDDGITYFWGMCSSNSSFAPLDYLGVDYGCTYIEYKNPETGKYEIL